VLLAGDALMKDLLIFTNDKTGDKVGIYYYSWISIVKSILMKYEHKTIDEANIILENGYYNKSEHYYEVLMMSHELEYHWAMLGAYGEMYWQKGLVLKSLTIILNGTITT
jgi:hypothetical protein